MSAKTNRVRIDEAGLGGSVRYMGDWREKDWRHGTRQSVVDFGGFVSGVLIVGRVVMPGTSFLFGFGYGILALARLGRVYSVGTV